MGELIICGLIALGLLAWCKQKLDEGSKNARRKSREESQDE
jgi:hypothetical protein